MFATIWGSPVTRTFDSQKEMSGENRTAISGLYFASNRVVGNIRASLQSGEIEEEDWRLKFSDQNNSWSSNLKLTSRGKLIPLCLQYLILMTESVGSTTTLTLASTLHPPLKFHPFLQLGLWNTPSVKSTTQLYSVYVGENSTSELSYFGPVNWANPDLFFH